MFNRTSLLTLAAALTACTLSIASNAATLIRQATYPVEASTSPTFQITIPQGFDSSLGTINSITIHMDTAATADLTVFNFTGSAKSWTNGSTSTLISLVGPDGVTTQTVTASQSVASGVAQAGFNNYGPGGNSYFSDVNVGAANFASYIGGPLVFNGSFASPNSNFNSVPNVFVGGDSQIAAGTITVTFDYTPNMPATTPEPGTCMMVMGLLSSGAGMAFRKRRQSKMA